MSKHIHDASQRLNQWLDGTYTYQTYRCGPSNGGHPSLQNDVRIVLLALPEWPIEPLQKMGEEKQVD